MVLDDPFATDVEQLHQTTSLGANIDPAYDEVRQSLAGKPLVDFAFGRVSLKDLRQDEVVELFVIQALIEGRSSRRYGRTHCSAPARPRSIRLD